MGVLGGSPETYHLASLRWGTATSSSTRTGTTSATRRASLRRQSPLPTRAGDRWDGRAKKRRPSLSPAYLLIHRVALGGPGGWCQGRARRVGSGRRHCITCPGSPAPTLCSRTGGSL